MADSLDTTLLEENIEKAIQSYGNFIKLDMGDIVGTPFNGVSVQSTPFGGSVGKEVSSDENTTKSVQVGLGGINGISPELFVRTENAIVAEGEDGESQIVTGSFWDIGYLQGIVSNPGEPVKIANNSALWEHQKNVSFFGVRGSSQLRVSDDSQLSRAASIGVTLEGEVFAEATLASVHQAGDWKLSAAAQASYSDNLPQLDIKLGAETPFKVSGISGVFNTEVQGSANPEKQHATAVAGIDVRLSEADDWKGRLSASFKTAAAYDAQQQEMEITHTVGAYVDTPSIPLIDRVGVEVDNNGKYAAVFTQGFDF